MSKFFINRPIVAMVIAILTVIVGAVTFFSLPTAQYPNIVPPEIRVSAIYPGADAVTLEQSVATPIEEQLSGVDNMQYMYSVNSSSGQTQILVDFDVKTDPNIDQVLTQLRYSQAAAQLPAQVTAGGVTVLKSLSSPLMLVALYSPHGSYNSIFLANYAYINLVDQLTRTPGIAQVQVFGAGQYAMRVWVDPDRLATLHLTVPNIVQAVQAQNTVNPAGAIGGEPVPSGQPFTYTVRAPGRLISPEQFSNIILRANPDGSNVKLGDVARIELGAQTYNLAGRYNGKPAAICLAAVFMGMLNARGHFFIPAMGATMLNVVMISSVLFLAPRMGLSYPPDQRLPHQVFALPIGVLAAGVAQAAFQLPTLWREGFSFHWVSPWRDPTVQRVVKQMLPATIGVAAFQINVVLTQGLSYWVDDYVVASFQYAVRLMELPQGLFGISLATYLLPTLSGLATEKNYDGFRTELRQGIAYLFFTNLIAAVLLIVLAEPIFRLLFERGKFDATSTSQASLALICLAPGLVAFSVVNILARAFFALGDTRTPMKITVFCLALNLLLSVALVWHFKQGGLGIANTITSLFNMGLLAYALRRKLKTLDMASLCRPVLTLLFLAVLAGVIAFEGWQWWEKSLGHANVALKIGAVFVPAGVAGGLYWLLALLFKVPAAREITEFALTKFKRRS